MPKFKWWHHLLLILLALVLLKLPSWLVFNQQTVCNDYCPYGTHPCYTCNKRWCELAKCHKCIDTNTLECHAAVNRCHDVYTTEGVPPWLQWASGIWMLSVVVGYLIVVCVYPKSHEE